MSVTVVPDVGSAEERQLQATEVGGTKPLHRFIRGEPKTIGVVMLFLGGAQFIFGIPMRMDPEESNLSFSPFWLGAMFVICGILYVLVEHSPTKKLVTASLALSIVATLGTALALLQHIVSMVTINANMHHMSYYYPYHNITREEHLMERSHLLMLLSMEGVFVFHTVLGGVILVVMTAFARTALKSTKIQAVVIMHNLPSE